MGYGPWSQKRIGQDLATKHTHIHTHTLHSETPPSHSAFSLEHLTHSPSFTQYIWLKSSFLPGLLSCPPDPPAYLTVTWNSTCPQLKPLFSQNLLSLHMFLNSTNGKVQKMVTSLVVQGRNLGFILDFFLPLILPANSESTQLSPSVLCASWSYSPCTWMTMIIS